jgi:hypothetical protein
MIIGSNFMVMPRYIPNKILVTVSICCVISALTLSCPAKNDSAWTYEREYYVNFEHGFREGLGEVEVNGKWGFINSVGEIVIKPKFNQVINPFTEGTAIVREGALIDTPKARYLAGKIGGQIRFIDRKGRTIWNSSGEPLSEGFAVAYVGSQWGMLSIILEQEGKWGFINAKGEMVIPARYDGLGSFSEGLAAFRDPNNNTKWGYINSAGEVVIEPRYSSAHVFSEGLAAVGIFGDGVTKYGFINKRGNVVIPLKYDSARSFSEGLAAVEKNDKWGVIDEHGEVAISFECHYIREFSEGLAGGQKE